MKLTLDTPITKLRMVGPAYASKLKKLEISSIEDLFYHKPSRYTDYSTISPIGRSLPLSVVTVRGTILKSRNVYTRSRKVIQKLLLEDESGKLEATWFNQPFLMKTLKPGVELYLSGEVKRTGEKLEMLSPEYELNKGSQEASIHTGRLVPVYPETGGVSSKWLRSRIAPLINMLLPKLDDWLPQTILKKEGLVSLSQAIKDLHFPQSLSDVNRATERLAFDEMFLIQLTSQMRKRSWSKKKAAMPIPANKKEIQTFLDELPFKLTSAQTRSTNEILRDLSKNHPMNRLLLGDVGSGKTVVAAAAIYASYLCKAKSALMAPTEILAAQHEKTIKRLLKPFGLKVAFCTASRKVNLKRFDIIIGTHALLFNRVKRENYGIVIIDEQHRFGVEQRSNLVRKGVAPHILTMTATPIPRTVALTLYGDLDLSVIDEMPPGRIKVKTWVVPLGKREAAYDWISKHVKEAEQAFIVCPLIESSSHESMAQIRAASEEFTHLSKKIFPDLPLGLLHGRLKVKEKQRAIDAFRSGKTKILVTTPVVEVGIDIPQATIMMIEGAERFGLAQLHQLRGRVGRGEKQSYCLLFTSTMKAGKGRLRALETARSGSELAQLDLKLRGPGEIFGVRQHGFTKLKFTSFANAKLIGKTRNLAKNILNKDPKLSQYPTIKKKITSLEKPVEPN